MHRLSPAQTQKFQKTILGFYKEHGRTHLPWRTDNSPYRVLVSEIMLQQTQVDRVITKFNNFMKVAPTIQKLAKLSQTDVLKLWQGLGYNSRALRLHKVAQIIVKDYKGKIPQEKEVLLTLPGIGPYTASAVRVFAYNLPDTFIETNIRRVFIHEFFKKKTNIHDKEILSLIERTLHKKNPRIWYEALMDYGSTLPKLLKHNPNKNSKHYAKQSKFSGSDRELRGKILRLSLAGKKIDSKTLGEKPERVKKVMNSLRKDGFKL